MTDYYPEYTALYKAILRQAYHDLRKPVNTVEFRDADVWFNRSLESYGDDPAAVVSFEGICIEFGIDPKRVRRVFYALADENVSLGSRKAIPTHAELEELLSR